MSVPQVSRAPRANYTFNFPKERRVDKVINSIAALLFRIASYLTDPICKAHEFYMRASVTSKILLKNAFYVAAVAHFFLAGITTSPGILFRFIGNRIQRQSFICWQGKDAKILPKDKKITISSWNICCMVAGFAFGENLVPWSFRIDRIIDDLVKKDADVNCLYETFDASAAFYITKRLKAHGYKHFYFNIGSRALGVSSGIMIASKYKVEEPEFTVFAQDTLLGPTKFSSKGVFAFTLTSKSRLFARIYATHLQHSDIAQQPKKDEINARKKQMELIGREVDKYREKHPNICLLVTGDLNLDDKEFAQLKLGDIYDKGEVKGPETFGGNISQGTGPLNLDHTMAVKGSVASVRSSVDQTNNYNPLGLQGAENAPSDHKLLYTEVKLL